MVMSHWKLYEFYNYQLVKTLNILLSLFQPWHLSETIEKHRSLVLSFSFWSGFDPNGIICVKWLVSSRIYFAKEIEQLTLANNLPMIQETTVLRKASSNYPNHHIMICHHRLSLIRSVCHRVISIVAPGWRREIRPEHTHHILSHFGVHRRWHNDADRHR